MTMWQAERSDFFSRLSMRKGQRLEIERYAATRLQSRFRGCITRSECCDGDARDRGRARTTIRLHVLKSLSSTKWAISRTQVAKVLRAKRQKGASLMQGLQRQKLARGKVDEVRRDNAARVLQSRLPSERCLELP